MTLLWTHSNIFWCVKRPQGMPSPTLFLSRQAADAPVITFPDVVDSHEDAWVMAIQQNATWLRINPWNSDFHFFPLAQGIVFSDLFPFSIPSAPNHTIIYCPTIFQSILFVPFCFPCVIFFFSLTLVQPNSTFLPYLFRFFFYYICLLYLFPLYYPTYLHLYISCWSLFSTFDFL